MVNSDVIRVTGDAICAESDDHLRLNLCQDGSKLLDHCVLIGSRQFAILPS